MRELLLIFLGLWALSALVLVFYRQRHRLSPVVLQIVLGALLALSIWGLPPLINLQLQILTGAQIAFLISPRLFVPVVYLVILLHFIIGGRLMVAPLLASQSIVLLVAGFVLPLLVAAGQFGREILGASQSLILTPGALRVQLAESASLLAGLYLLILLYQRFRERLRRLPRWLMAGLTLLVAGAIQGALSASGAYWGSGIWLRTVFGELTGWVLATVVLIPVIQIGLRMEGESQLAGQSTAGWPLLRMLGDTLSIERALRLSEDRVADLNQKLNLLTELRQDIVRAGDERELIELFCQRLNRSEDFAVCWIGLISEEPAEFRELAWAGRGMSKFDQEERIGGSRAAQQPWTSDSEEREFSVVKLALEHPLHQNAIKLHEHGFATFPLQVDGRTLGVFLVYPEARPVTASEEQLLAGIAEDMSFALQRLQLQSQRRRRVRELDAVREVMTELISEHDVSRLLEIVIERAVNLLEAESGEIYLVRRGQQYLSPAALYGTEARDKEGGPSQQIAREVAAGGGARIIAQESDGGASVTPRQSLSAPLQWGEQVSGVINVHRRSNHPFSGRDLGLLELLANQAALAIENARLIESERQRSAELEILREASLSMTSSLELESVLPAILEQALEAVSAYDAHIFTYDGEVLSFGAALWAGDVQGEPFSEPRPDGITYTVAHTGERIVVEHSATHPIFQDTPWAWDGSIISLPLKVAGRVLGVMNVAYEVPHSFNDQELHVLELLADQAALVVENARLYERTVAEQRRLKLLYDVGRELATSLDPDILLQRAIEVTRENLGGLIGGVMLADRSSDEMRVVAVSNMPTETLEDLNESIRINVGEGLVGWVAAHGEPAYAADVAKDSRWAPIPGVDDMVRSALAAPIFLGEQKLGVMAIFHSEAGVFDDEHVDLMVAICQQVSLAWSNARRYRQVERRLAERTVLQQVAQVINRRLDMEGLLEAVVEQVSGVLGYPVVDITLVEGNELVLRARSAPRPIDEFRIEITRGIVGRVARTGEPTLVQEVSQDPDYIALEPSTSCEIAVPLHKGDVIIGILNVESPFPGTLGEDDLRLLTLLADQISVAIENAALYDRLRNQTEQLEEAVTRRTAELRQALDRAREADRLKTQFVSDVSHELRTPLSNIRLYVELLSQTEKENFDQYLATLGRETERLVTLIEDLLSISRLDSDSVPVHLKRLDLNELAKALVDDRQRLFSDRQLALNWRPEVGEAWIYADERLLSQVIANLMTNAMHYTPAGGQVTLSTAKDGKGEWICLKVSDTGLGIPESEMDMLFARFFRGSASRKMGNPGTGLGLAITQEIVQRHGGRVTVDSKEKEGSQFI
ncbi:MAG: GAF domain-containing protein, partial [Anaerolineales bacterium]